MIKEILEYFGVIIIELILYYIYDPVCRINRYLEQFKAYRFTRVIILSKLSIWVAAGILFGTILGLVIERILSAAYDVNFSIDYFQVLKGTALGIIGGLIGCLYEYCKEWFRIRKAEIHNADKSNRKEQLFSKQIKQNRA